MPCLRTSAAPLRIVIKGDVKRWVISALKNIRTMTNKQLHQRKLYEDWMIVIYGHEGDGKDYWEVDHNRGKVSPGAQEGPLYADERTLPSGCRQTI